MKKLQRVQIENSNNQILKLYQAEGYSLNPSPFNENNEQIYKDAGRG